MLGRITASQRFLTFGSAPVGALLAGALATVVGIRFTLWVLMIAMAVSTVLLFNRPIMINRDLPTGI